MFILSIFESCRQNGFQEAINAITFPNPFKVNISCTSLEVINMYGGRHRGQDKALFAAHERTLQHHSSMAPKKTTSFSRRPSWDCRSCVGKDDTAQRMSGFATHCSKCYRSKGSCHMPLPPRAPCAERPLCNERSAKKEGETKNAKDMDKLAKENKELREKLAVAEGAAASASAEAAENAERADSQKDFVSGTFKFHS